MQFREEKTVTKAQKQTYLDGLNALIRTRQRQAQSERDLYIQNIFSDADRYRNDLREMLGWPLNTHFEGLPRVQSTRLGEENGYIITRMQFEILDGVWLGGLLFQKGEQKKPLVIVSHGGLGTPELISGFYDGNTENYNGILDRVLQYDVHAFAPQWLLWHSDYEVPFDRARIDGALKSVGSSITAVELHGLFHILDWLEAQSYVASFGMVGLSYGGFYTLFATALETRIRSAVSCSFFNDRDEIHWTDWLWEKVAYRFNDAEIAALCYPRHLCIEVGAKDELFECRYAQRSFDRLCTISKAQGVGTDWVDFIVFDGNHEFCRNDKPLERLVHDLTNVHSAH